TTYVALYRCHFSGSRLTARACAASSDRFRDGASQFFGLGESNPVADDVTLPVDEKQRRKDCNSPVGRVAFLRPVDNGEINPLLLDVPLAVLIAVVQVQEAVSVGAYDAEPPVSKLTFQFH